MTASVMRTERTPSDLRRLAANPTGAAVVYQAVDGAGFKHVLRQSGFYSDWRGKFGEAAWSLLEEHAGALS